MKKQKTQSSETAEIPAEQPETIEEEKEIAAEKVETVDNKAVEEERLNSLKPLGEKVDAKTFKTPKETEAAKRKGLTVVGKMDLGEEKKQEAGEEKTRIVPATEAPKKKKKPKARKKAEDSTEELPAAKKKKRVKKFEIDEKDVKAAIRKTF